MTVIWLIIWLIKGIPSVTFADWDLNNWAIALVICLAIDIFGGSRR